jgi:hypothetical protein
MLHRGFQETQAESRDNSSLEREESSRDTVLTCIAVDAAEIADNRRSNA